MHNNNFYFTLPDNISIKRNLLKKKLSNNFFLYLFYLFRFFIFKESIYKFNIINYIIHNNLYLNNINKHTYYFYLIYYNKLSKNNIFNSKLLNINNLSLNILFLFNNVLNFDILKFDIFYKKKNINVFFYEDFALRVHFSLFIGFTTYLKFFKLSKYNEYLSINSELNNYPILKVILKNNVRVVNFDKNDIILSQEGVSLLFQIYFDNSCYYYCNNNSSLFFSKFTLLLILNKIKFVKFLLIFNKLMYIFVFKYFKIYFLNIFFIFLYNIWIYECPPKILDWVQSFRWNIFYLFHLYWWLYKYNWNLPIWLYLLIIIYMIKLYLFNYIHILNILNLNLLKKKNYFFSSFINISLYKIISIIFNTYFESLYFRFFKIMKTRNLRLFTEKWMQTWKVLIKQYPFDFLFTSTRYYLNNVSLKSLFKQYKYSIDIIHWKIFFMGNKLNNNKLKLDISTTSDKLKVDAMVKLEYKMLLNNILHYLSFKYKEIFIVNFFFFFTFLRDIFVKIIIKKKLYNYFKFKLLELSERKQILWALGKILGKNKFIKHVKKYEHLYQFIYEKKLCLIIYIIFINKYLA